MMKGWFDIESEHADSKAGEELNLTLEFFAYNKERDEGTGDTYFPDATLQITRYYDDDDRQDWYGINQLTVSMQGREELFPDLIALVGELDVIPLTTLSEILTVCTRYFDEGRSMLSERQATFQQQPEVIVHETKETER